ncbi:MAG TPA: DNA polymerase III subunit delta' [Myxococcaceae bacterium]|nr:DNA polymerase III subunit delta' [Myxococcaceae bacterium]
MSFDAVQGQDRVVEALKAALGRDQVHHAYLFSGAEGVGKARTALVLAQALVCPAKPAEGCGTCPSCLRVERRNHPDVHWVLPEDEQVARGWAGRSDFGHAPSRDIRVEQVRQLQERLARHALEGARKVAVVGSAHRLNPQAQNAFLKTLEEPPHGTVLILTTTAPDRLLPTLRSRLCKLSFRPLPPPPLAAKALERRREIISQFEGLIPNDARGWLAFAEAWGKSRDSADEVFAVLGEWTRECLRVQAGAPATRDPELEATARAAADRRAPRALHWQGDLIERAAAEVSGRNASPRLQLERLLIGLRAEG